MDYIGYGYAALVAAGGVIGINYIIYEKMMKFINCFSFLIIADFRIC